MTLGPLDSQKLHLRPVSHEQILPNTLTSDEAQNAIDHSESAQSITGVSLSSPSVNNRDMDGVRGEKNYFSTAEFSEKVRNLTEIAEEKRIQFPTKKNAIARFEQLKSNGNKELSGAVEKLKELSTELEQKFAKLSKMTVEKVNEMLHLDKSKTEIFKLLDAIDDKFNEIDDILVKACNTGGRTEVETDIERLQEDYAVFHTQLNHTITLCYDLDPKSPSELINQKTTFLSLLQAENGKMSGSTRLLRTIQDEINPILDRLEMAKNNDNSASLEINLIIKEAQEAVKFLWKIREDGVALDPNKPEDIIIAPRLEMDALITTLRNNVTNLTEKKEAYFNNLISKSIKSLSIYEKISRCDSDIVKWFELNNYHNVANVVKSYKQKIEETGYKGPLTQIDLKSDRNIVEDIINNVYKGKDKSTSVALFFSDLEEAVGKTWKKEGLYKESEIIDGLYSYFDKRTTQIYTEHEERLKLMEGLKESINGNLLTSDYTALLQGTDVVTLAYARASGLKNCHIQTGMSQTNLDDTKTKVLGSGNFNTVKLVQYHTKDSKGIATVREGVFKPEHNARLGLAQASAPRALGYKSKQRAIENNCAASFVAEQLGNPKIVAKSKFTIVDGEPGILMEKAEGREADTIIPQDFARFKKKDGIRMRGQLMRSLNQLQWTDVLCAQMDRHNGNILINIDPENKSISVTGVDNDACFGLNMVGMRSIRIPKKKYESIFKKELLNVNKVNGIKDTDDKQYVICNLEEVNPQMRIKLVNRFGVYGTAMPSVIDDETYDHLRKIDLETYRSQMVEYLQDEEAASVAVDRLKDAQEYAEKLFNKGLVFSKEEWEKNSTQQTVYEEQIKTVNRQTGLNVKTASKKQMDKCWNVFEPFFRTFSYLMKDNAFRD